VPDRGKNVPAGPGAAGKAADILPAGPYTITGLGVTVGFHRGLTHGSHRAVRPVRIAPPHEHPPRA